MPDECKFNWECFLESMEGCTSVDFSKCGIDCIPDDVLGKMISIQYLYLEGNQLTELSIAFFPTLRELRWLDLRNNKLKSIPNSILDHPSLQVLLLEGNSIENIPVEIGSVETLRGLQLARNPIRYPPSNIINQGVQNTIEFLRKQWQQMQSPQQIHLISETHPQIKAVSAQSTHGRKQKVGGSKSAVNLKGGSEEQDKVRKALSSLSAANLSKCINVQPISRQRTQTSVATRPGDTDQVLLGTFGPTHYEKRLKSSSKKQVSRGPLQHSQMMKNCESDLNSKLLRDIWIEKVREMLLKQEAILQRRKNTEALQQWQDETKLQQQTLSRKGASNAELVFPYDIDPEFLKMLSRKDMKEESYKRRDSSLHNVRHEEPINNKIVSIMAALQELQTSQSATSLSPRSEQMILSNEIKKIRDIQRSLVALKLKNFGQLGYSS